MDTAKNYVKVEADSVCRGCLSTNRALKPLQNNVDLFFTILGDRYIPEDCKYSNLLLCWECSAVLQRIAQYQAKIQHSLNIFLDNTLEILQPLQCLSNLETSVKLNYDYVLEYTDVIIDIPIKYEFQDEDDFNDSCTGFDDTHNTFEPKEEKVNDTIESENDSIEKKHIKEEGIPFIIKKIKKESKYKSRCVKPTKISYDIDDIDAHLKPFDFKVQDLEDMKNKKYNKNEEFTLYLVRRHITSILSRRRKDLKKRDDEKPIQCSYCNNKITDCIKKHWEEHIFTLFKCAYCNLLFNTKENCLSHLKSSHDKIFRCKCGFPSWNQRQYLTHYKNFHKTFICYICNKKCYRKELIESHIKYSHLPVKCEECQKPFENRRRLQNHVYLHHPELKGESTESVYCVECDLRFQNRFLYMRHLRSAVAHNPRPYKPVPCPECGKMFSRKNYMKNHYNFAHAKQSKYYCELCDKYFVNGHGIRKHKLYVHDKEEKPRTKVCHICDRAFNSNVILQNHIRTHTGERPFKCDYCDVAFAQLTAKKSHEKTQHQRVKVEIDPV